MKFRQLFTAIMAVVLVFSFTQKANSQVLISLLLGDKLNTEKLKFGLDGGLNYSTISNIDPSRYRPNFNLGFYFDFLLKKDPKYPGMSPFSTYRGYRYQGGFSDHLPVLLDLGFRQTDRQE